VFTFADAYSGKLTKFPCHLLSVFVVLSLCRGVRFGGERMEATLSVT
jgi:hypothetical protein